MKKLIALAFLMPVLYTTCMAQDEFDARKEFSFGVGAQYYHGDLAPFGKEFAKMARPMGHVGLAYVLTDKIRARLGFALGSIIGDDTKYKESSFRQDRGLRFTTTTKELSLGLLYNIYGHNFGNSTNFAIYLMAGGAYNFVNIKRNLTKANGNLNPDQLAQDLTAKLPSGVPVFFGGGGMQLRIAQNWKMFGEGNYRVTGNRYLDGYRFATNNSRDDYFSVSIGFVYSFGGYTYYSCPRNKY